MFRELFPFWNSEYRQLDIGAILRWYGLWMGLVGLIVVGWVAFGLLPKESWRASLFFISIIVLGSHQVVRELLARQLPSRSFQEDLRTGNLDQLRLLLFQPHALLFHRFFPRFALRLMVNALWLPLYMVWGVSVGLNPLTIVCWWILLAFGTTIVLAILLVFLLAFSVELLTLAFGLLLLVPFLYRFAEGRSVLWVGLLIALVVGFRFVQSVPTPLPSVEALVWLWLCVEALRYHRLADWLNTPTGMVRHLWLVPTTGLIGYYLLALNSAQALLNGWTPQQAWEYGVAGVLMLSGWLSLVTLTLERGRELVQQTLGYHLRVSLLQRLLAVALVLSSMPIVKTDFSNGAFWAVFLWLMLWGGLSSGLVRSLIQVCWSSNRQMVFVALAVGMFPAVLGSILPNSLTHLTVFSPAMAMMSQTSVWSTFAAKSVPPLLAGFAPMVQTLLVVGVLYFGRRGEVSLSRPLRFALNLLIGLLMLYPVWDKIAVFSNPLSRMLRVERTPNFAFWAGLAGLLVGALSVWEPGWIFTSLIVLGLFLWLWGYSLTARRSTRLRDSGELTSIFLANLTASQIFWGLVYSSWYQQVRVLIAFVWAGLVGYFITYNLAPPAFAGGHQVFWQAMFIITFSSAFIAFFLVMWSCAWLISPPMAVRDVLLQSSQASQRSLFNRVLAATASVLLGLCIVLAPLLLIFLPIYSSQTIHRLRKMQQRPGEG